VIIIAGAAFYLKRYGSIIVLGTNDRSTTGKISANSLCTLQAALSKKGLFIPQSGRKTNLTIAPAASFLRSKTAGATLDCADCHTPETSGNYGGSKELYFEKIIHWREPNAGGNVK